MGKTQQCFLWLLCVTLQPQQAAIKTLGPGCYLVLQLFCVKSINCDPAAGLLKADSSIWSVYAAKVQTAIGARRRKKVLWVCRHLLLKLLINDPSHVFRLMPNPDRNPQHNTIWLSCGTHAHTQKKTLPFVTSFLISILFTLQKTTIKKGKKDEKADGYIWLPETEDVFHAYYQQIESRQFVFIWGKEKKKSD